jgi:hypothetical protein
MQAIGTPGSDKIGTLPNALRMVCVPLALVGLVAPEFVGAQRVALKYLLSHYQYAAWSWASAAGLWALWHSRRLFKKDDDA